MPFILISLSNQVSEDLASTEPSPVREPQTPNPRVTHPGHNALNQQTGAERQAAGAIEGKELFHLLQACAEDPLRGTGEGVR